jgi:hypothetical protein
MPVDIVFGKDERVPTNKGAVTMQTAQPTQTLYTPLAEYGVQAAAAAVQTCGPHTGHTVKNVAFCDTPETAAFIVNRCQAAAGILSLIGNVDHSRGGGPNTARLYGQMLTDIRDLLTA